MHRVENPLGLLRLLAGRLNENGRILIETYGVRETGDNGHGSLQVPAPGTVYPRDSYVYWQFSSSALGNLAAFIDSTFELHAAPLVDGHPRIIGTIKPDEL